MILDVEVKFVIPNNSGRYKIFHLSGQFGSLDPSVRYVILDTN